MFRGECILGKDQTDLSRVGECSYDERSSANYLLCGSKRFSGRRRIASMGRGRTENPIRSTAQNGKDHITVLGRNLGILAFWEQDQCLYGRFQ